MSRKFSKQDREVFRQVFLQFAWMPAAHLVQLMQVMAELQALPEKWEKFHEGTASRWIAEGNWREQVDSLRYLVGFEETLPTDTAIDDLLMRRNLQMLDWLGMRLLGGIGDPAHNMRHYIALQAQIRIHVQLRRAMPLTPEQLIDLFLGAGEYVAGRAFDKQKAREVLITKLAEARQLAPVRAG